MNIEVRNISSSYADKKILNNLSFKIGEKEITAIIGENGSGKTTLLKSLCNLIKHEGSLYIDDKKISDLSYKEIAKLISYIPQKSGIDIDISVLDVVLMGFNSKLKPLENVNEEMINIAINSLEELGLSDYIDESYLKLSEGQKQLALLARSLVSDAPLLLLDEPESSLDFNWRYQLFSLLKESGKTVIIVLHDAGLAINYADKLVLIKDGKVADEVYPLKDSSTRIEEAFNKIYENVKISETADGDKIYRSIYKSL